jgi:hypothetical protein
MGHDSLFDALLMLAWLWLCMLGWWTWRHGRPAPLQAAPTPAKPIKKRAKESTPFTGLIHKPLCEACEHAVALRLQASYAPPPLLMFPPGRRRTVNTQLHFCPEHQCTYYGWPGRGSIRANGHLIISACRMPRSACLWRLLSRPMARVQPGSGSPAYRQWPPG